MLNALWQFLAMFWSGLYSVLSWVFTQVIALLVFIVTTVLDGLFSVTLALINGLDFGTLITNLAVNWDLVDARFIYVINAVGLPQCLTMILGAIGFRMLLNLIPAAVTRI